MKNDYNYNKNTNEKENKVNYENINSYQPINDNSNSLYLFKQASYELKKNNNEKVINKDEKTIQTIRELLGENNLEIIFKNTNYSNIKKYDIIYKKSKNICGAGFGNFDIQVKNNNIKYNKNKKKFK